MMTFYETLEEMSADIKKCEYDSSRVVLKDAMRTSINLKFSMGDMTEEQRAKYMLGYELF